MFAVDRVGGASSLTSFKPPLVTLQSRLGPGFAVHGVLLSFHGHFTTCLVPH